MPGAPLSSTSIASAVIPVEKTWQVRKDTPYFDSRLVVETCAQFVTSSFRVRLLHGESSVISPTPAQNPGKRITPTPGQHPGKDGSKETAENNKTCWNIAFPQVVISHAHNHTGAERLIQEIVPRCKELREQLHQTVYPLCVDSTASRAANPQVEGKGIQHAVDYEVDRFLRSRLVTCDLGELMSSDVFWDADVDVRGRLATVAAGADDTSSEENEHTAPPVPVAASLSVASNPYLQAKKETELEVVLRRFEVHFWQTFTNGLGRSLFGTGRSDLVEQFEISTRELFNRYQGKLQLAMNSLMGWLPSWMSESLFVAFLGLAPGVAVRQRAEKFKMLQHCIGTLVRSSGRYIFLSTPSWYLPLVSWLPDLEKKDRSPQGAPQVRLSLRSMWPSTVLEPAQCVVAVNAAWGGHIPGKRGSLQLLPGLELLGPWVARMTGGSENYLTLALQHIRDFAPVLERAFDELVESGTLDTSSAPEDPTVTRRWAAEQAQALYSFAVERVDSPSVVSSTTPGPGPSPNPSPSSSTGVVENSLDVDGHGHGDGPGDGHESGHDPGAGHVVGTAAGTGAGAGGGAGDAGLSGVDTDTDIIIAARTRTASGLLGPGPDGTSNSLLQMLHVGAENSAAEIGACRLRRAITTSAGGPQEVTWPLGQPNSLNGRIPIHDSPELLPTTVPEIMEGAWGDAADFTLPEQAVQLPRVARLGSNPRFPTKSPSRSPCQSPLLNVSLKSSLTSKGGRRNARLFVPPSSACKLERSTSSPAILGQAPQPLVAMQPELALTYGRTSRDKGKNRKPAVSAPPAVDTREFQHGDPIRNSVIALALQIALQRRLCVGRPDNTLHMFWRRGNPGDERRQLQRLRLGLGAVMLLAVWRAPLPVAHRMPLPHFFYVAAGIVQEREMLAAPQVALPDGILLMGCSANFNTAATDCSAQLSPRASPAFFVGLPQCLLDGALLHSTLVERRSKAPPFWSPGCLPVLLASAALLATCTPAVGQSAIDLEVCQDHRSVFPLACVFRLFLGLEYMRLWHNQCLQRNSEVRTTTLEDLLPFLRDCPCLTRSLSAQLDWSASTSGSEETSPGSIFSQDTQRPCLPAPTICIDEDDEPYMTTANYALLKDFAAWVGSLKPGRVVYSSHTSETADLYWRMEGAVVALSFTHKGGSAPVTGFDVMRSFEKAVGDPTRWGVPLVSFIMLSSRISSSLESACRSGTCAAFGAGQSIDGGGQVPAGCEVLVGIPLCLWSLLGSLKAPLLQHRRVWEGEMAEGDRARARTATAHPWRGLPVGTGKNAVTDWRLKRPRAPKLQQLEVNRDLLQALLEHILAHSRKLHERVEELYGDGDSSQGSALSSNTSNTGSPPGTANPAEVAAGSPPGDSAATGQASALTEEGPTAGKETVNVAKVDSRVPSPERTEKASRWRPPTPHPAAQRPNKEEARRLSLLAPNRSAQDFPAFDFAGFGDWRTAVLQHQRVQPPPATAAPRRPAPGKAGQA